MNSAADKWASAKIKMNPLKSYEGKVSMLDFQTFNNIYTILFRLSVKSMNDKNFLNRNRTERNFS